MAVQQDDKMAEGKLVGVDDADAPVKSPSKEFLQEGIGSALPPSVHVGRVPYNII